MNSRSATWRRVTPLTRMSVPNLLVQILDPGRHIHRVSHQGVDEPVRAAHAAGKDLAGMDPDPVCHRLLPLCGSAPVQLAKAESHVQGRLEGHLRMIRQPDRGPEHRFDLIADVLEYDPPDASSRPVPFPKNTH